MKRVVESGMPSGLQGAPLSPQEKRCLAYSAHGYTTRRIADVLHISERTVELYFSQIRSKLNVANRQEAVAKAIADRIIHRGDLPEPRKASERVQRITSHSEATTFGAEPVNRDIVFHGEARDVSCG